MVKVRVPATSANLGCGFDTLGIALNLYTTFEFEKIDSGVEFEGFEEQFSNEDNLVYVTFKRTLEKLGREISGVRIKIESNVPISRGLGSSSTCVVGGIYGAYAISKIPFNKDKIFDIATEIEGHPDNVSPAIYGGLTASCTVDSGESFTTHYDIDSRFNFLALIPNFETSTNEARRVMPKQYDIKDVVYSLSRLGLVLKSFENYDLKLLSKVMGDKIHEPYRKEIIHEYAEVRKICEEIDSVCFFISGSGSTLMNIVKDKSNISLIKEKLDELKYSWRVVALEVDKQGTIVE